MNNFLSRENLPIKIQTKTINLPKNKLALIKTIFPLLILFFLSSCAPTYLKEEVIESIEKISREEYGIEAKAKLINRTVCVAIADGDFFNLSAIGKISFNPEKEKELNKMVFSITRILLSSNIDIDFYRIKFIDKNKKVNCSIIGEANDLKQSWVGSFSPGELSMRRLLDIKTSSSKDFSEEKIFEEVKWPDFLIKQIRKRVLIKFSASVELIGNYKKGEQFFFLLGSSETDPKIIRFVIQTIARVLEAYKFEDFESVNLLDLKTGKLNTLDKEQLKKYR